MNWNRELEWRHLLPGVAIIITLTILAVLILTAVGLGNIPGRKFTIFARAEQARGILHGSAVWVAGTRVGTVAGVQFVPATSGIRDRVVIEVRILERFRAHLRRDSRAEIRPGSRLISNPVLEVSQGSPAQAPVADGDTIETAEQLDVELVVASAQAALADLPPALRELRSTLTRSGLADTLVARLIADDSISVVALIGRITRTFQELAAALDRGALGLALSDSGPLPRFRSTGLLLDSALRRMDPENSAAAAFLSSSGPAKRVDSVATRFDSLLLAMTARSADWRSGSRAAALNNELGRLVASLKALRDDARRHPLRYIVF
jgi:hypothetical protein